MKYCHKCGNQMDDDMLFCQKCGTKAVSPAADTEERPYAKGHEHFEERYIQQAEHAVPQSKAVPKSRKGMKVLSVVCFVLAVIYALISLMEPFILGMTVFCGVLGVMFLVLSKSPKDNVHILGKQSGLKKSTFVIICVILAFGLFGGLMTTLEAPPAANSGVVSSDTPKQETATTLEDVEKWYEKQMPGVTQSLIEYSESVDGISNVNVTESKFLFGEDSGWYDCHYTVYFTCKVNGAPCTGEARAFLKYAEDEVSWFHFEIFKDSDWSSIVEHYDDSYDQIIEDYYKELSKQFK